MKNQVNTEDILNTFPLEKVAYYLRNSLDLLEAAQAQWNSEKDALLNEISRLRLENRTLRIQVHEYNVDGEEMKVSMQRSGISMNSTNISNSTSLSQNRCHSAASNKTPEGFIDTSYNYGEYFKSPNRTNSQTCKVRRIQLKSPEEPSSPTAQYNNELKPKCEPKTIKYREIGRVENRCNLPAYECVECTKFYNAFDSDTKNKADTNKLYKSFSPIACSHNMKESMLASSGKHRYLYAPTKSPPGYWDLDM
ncbi:hypothetical protein cand_017210 [Cryptosporidium andersoni]|uniref:DNA endonuclease activator Ctp1 C-terminal domain-containing protein n=1 Tax=Cryptosporidium andersoni TaxID=117008 RepID=A0A1J4MTH8_9CRYT|nr:hypothetical protein cand_017210 [Cryptosporidium andersoni]